MEENLTGTGKRFQSDALVYSLSSFMRRLCKFVAGIFIRLK